MRRLSLKRHLYSPIAPAFLLPFISVQLSFILQPGNSRPETEQRTKVKSMFGMEKLNDTLFIDNAEISVKLWNEFSNLNNGLYPPDSECIKTKPYKFLFERNQTSLMKRVSINGFFRGSKANVPADKWNRKTKKILDYPIVGITHEQATAYCKWRTAQYNLQYFGISNSSEYKIRFELPSVLLYKQLIIESDSLNSKCTSSTFNCKGAEVNSSIPKEWSFISPGKEIVPVFSYWYDKNNLFNVRGNVAEMTNQKGIAMGGSYLNYANECTASNVQQYQSATGWLGFRCVGIVVR